MNQNINYIPELLPISTLACPPSSSQLKRLMRNRTIEQNGSTNMNVKTNIDNQTFDQNDVYVVKWVDYSCKYGLGYLLNNGCIGINFNDSTKIVVDSTDNEIKFRYFEKHQNLYENSRLVDMDNQPSDLKKKITLFNYFEGYLMNNFSKVGKSSKMSRRIHVKKWVKNNKAIVFRLTNKVVQVIFQDHTQILLDSNQKVVIYTDKKDQRVKYQLDDAIKNDNLEMNKRLLYTKEILNQIISNKISN